MPIKSKLAAIQQYADYQAAILKLRRRPTVVWSSSLVTWMSGLPVGRKCRVTRKELAHAHADPKDPLYGHICIVRGHDDWQETVKHEIAHFAPGAANHSRFFYKALRKLDAVLAGVESRVVIYNGRVAITPRHYSRRACAVTACPLFKLCKLTNKCQLSERRGKRPLAATVTEGSQVIEMRIRDRKDTLVIHTGGSAA
jgi:hypothetical protein